MRRTRTFLLAGGLAAALAAGGSALALASSGGSGSHPARAQARSKFVAKLASELGKPADQVKSALKAERVATLRRRAANLQRRADSLAKGVRPGRAARGRGAGQAWESDLAKRLGVSQAKLDSALRAAIADALPARRLGRLAMIRA